MLDIYGNPAEAGSILPVHAREHGSPPTHYVDLDDDSVRPAIRSVALAFVVAILAGIFTVSVLL